MDSQAYYYRFKAIMLPGLSFFLIYPMIVGLASMTLEVPRLYLYMFSGIYLGSVFIILLLWLVAKTKKVYIHDDNIILRSILGKKVLSTADIRRIAFFWTKANEELVILKVGKKDYYLSNLYYPFNEMMSDLEEFIQRHQIRSNLASHYGMN